MWVQFLVGRSRGEGILGFPDGPDGKESASNVGDLSSIPGLGSHVRLFATPWTIARQAPLSLGFSRQEYWSGLPCPPPGDLPDPGIEPRSPSGQASTAQHYAIFKS